MLNETDVLALRWTCSDIKDSIDYNKAFWKGHIDRHIGYVKHKEKYIYHCATTKCTKFSHFYMDGPPSVSNSPLYEHTFFGYTQAIADIFWKTTRIKDQCDFKAVMSNIIVAQKQLSIVENIVAELSNDISKLRTYTRHTNKRIHQPDWVGLSNHYDHSKKFKFL